MYLGVVPNLNSNHKSALCAAPNGYGIIATSIGAGIGYWLSKGKNKTKGALIGAAIGQGVHLIVQDLKNSTCH